MSSALLRRGVVGGLEEDQRLLDVLALLLGIGLLLRALEEPAGFGDVAFSGHGRIVPRASSAPCGARRA